MRENKKLTIAIIMVTLIAIIVVSGTYAYWTWIVATNEQTKVLLTVPSGSTLLNASIDGGTMVVSKLSPATCGNTVYGAKSTVTLNYTNQSPVTAFVLGTLTVNNFIKPYGSVSGTITPSTIDLEYLRYSLRMEDTDCSTGTELASGNFAALYNTTTANIMTNVMLKNNISSGTTNGTQIMHLYIWLDKDYEYTNVGSGSVTDPMQDLSFTILWSGSINNTPVNQPA